MPGVLGFSLGNAGVSSWIPQHLQYFWVIIYLNTNVNYSPRKMGCKLIFLHLNKLQPTNDENLFQTSPPPLPKKFVLKKFASCYISSSTYNFTLKSVTANIF